MKHLLCQPSLAWASPEQVIINEVHLSPGIVVAEPIALPREVQPLWVPKLITNEGEVALSPQTHGDQSAGKEGACQGESG